MSPAAAATVDCRRCCGVELKCNNSNSNSSSLRFNGCIYFTVCELVYRSEHLYKFVSLPILSLHPICFHLWTWLNLLALLNYSISSRLGSIILCSMVFLKQEYSNLVVFRISLLAIFDSTRLPLSLLTCFIYKRSLRNIFFVFALKKRTVAGSRSLFSSALYPDSATSSMSSIKSLFYFCIFTNKRHLKSSYTSSQP